MAHLQKEAWEVKEDSLETKIENLAGANRGLAEGLMQALKERDGMQDLNTDLQGLNANLEDLNGELQAKIKLKVELNNLFFRKSVLKDSPPD